MLSELLNKRLILVSGKGGVGKTTVAVLLALVAAKYKKRTLLVEMNSSGLVAPLFNTSSNDQDEIPLAPYISGINLRPKKCFEEYVLRHIRFKSIYKTFFNNKFVSNFLDAVPGLNDILMLGKIYELERQYKNKILAELAYDLIIVDAPATGHGLSTLEVPNVLKSAVKIGPLHSHAQDILGLLATKEKTVFCLVTLAEEMPVNESQEYVQALTAKTDLHFGPLFINAVMPRPPKIMISKIPEDKHLSLILKYYELASERAKLNALYTEVIKKNFPSFDLITLPFQFSELKSSKNFQPLIADLLKEAQ